MGLIFLTQDGDNGFKAISFANSWGIPPAENNDNLANIYSHNAEGEGLFGGVLSTPLCLRKVSDNPLKTNEGSKGDIAIQPIGNVMDDWEPERLLEGLGVRLVDPRGKPLRVIVDSRDEQTSRKCLNMGMRSF